MDPHVTESLSAYMDGELPARDREAVAAHLRGCPSCSMHLEELRAVDAAARELPLSVPDGYFEALRGSVRRRLEGSRPAPRRLAPAWALAAAAALVLAVLTPRLLLDRGPAAPASRSVPAPTLGAPAPAPADERDRVTEAVPAAPRPEPAPRQPARPEGARLQRGRAEEQPAPATPPAAPPALPAPAAKADAPAAGANAAREQRDADALRALGYAGVPAEDGFAPTPQATKAEAETGAAGYAEEAKARRDKGAVGALQDRAAPAGEGRFGLLARRTVASAAEARSLRDAWRAFARDQPAGPHADEARVRAIEAGAEAWRKGKDERDRAETRQDGRAYLERPDALQADRVRAALRSLEP